MMVLLPCLILMPSIKAKFQLLDLNGVLQFEYDTSDFSQVAGLQS